MFPSSCSEFKNSFFCVNSKIEDEFELNDMSFVYGVIAGVGGGLLIAIAYVVIKLFKKKHDSVTSYEMNTYLDNDTEVAV